MSLSKLIIIYFLVLSLFIFEKNSIYFKINGFEVDSKGANPNNHVCG
jgi:hypothetical protein